MIAKVSMFAMLGILLTSAFSSACGETQCFDQCTGGYIEVYGDSCSSSFDSTKGCYTAVGNCSEGGGTTPVCGGTSCWNACTGSYEYFSSANTCHQVFENGCYAASGSCE